MKSFFYIVFVFSIHVSFAVGGLAQANDDIQEVIPAENENKWIPLYFSLEGGFYEDSVTVELTAPNATIYYTLNGAYPSRKYAEIYREPIKVSATTVIRAVARRANKRSKVIAHTFFINEPPSTFPVVSIAVTPSLLFDPETGLYIKGPNAIDSLWKKDGANFWSKREIKINTEIFETDRKNVFNSVTGFRLFGGMSRLFPQKSMTIVARDRYGKKRIKHQIFGKEGLKKFKYLVLRNSGSDWGKSHFRDALMTGLLEGWDIEKQDSRPAHVYLNGSYWGIYNIREKINRYFLEGHQEIDKDSVDLMEHRYSLKRGSRAHYLLLLRFMEKNDLSDPAVFAYVKSQMDVDNFMDYQIAQIYFDNKDAGGNIKFWRPQQPNGKWRWILYDTDWGFGLHDERGYKSNTLKFHTAEDGPSWPNPPWSTFILRKLLENEDFRQTFTNRFLDHMNTTFATERVIQHIHLHKQMLEPEIDRQIERWHLSKNYWQKNIATMENFAIRRPEYMYQFLQEYFDLGELIYLSFQSIGGGHIQLNENIEIGQTTIRGTYFEKNPISLKAIPHQGFRFSHWEGISNNNESMASMNISLKRGDVYNIKAIFEPYNHPLEGLVMINEVSCNNTESGDWVELYNASNEPVNLKDWMFTDSKNTFVLSKGTIPAKGYAIICEDTIQFRKYYVNPEISIAGQFNFGLSKVKENMGLFTADGAGVDSLAYLIAPVDTTFTISLLLPHLNNADPENWELRKGRGTPGFDNPYYLQSTIKAEQEQWMRVGAGIGIFLCCMLLVYMRRKKQEQLIKLQIAMQQQNSRHPNPGDVSRSIIYHPSHQKENNHGEKLEGEQGE